MSDIHKAFILGAGLGTRLRPLTERDPKPLIPFQHEPLAHHVLRHCQSAGIDTFAINTHYLPECWDQAFPDHHFNGASLTFFHETDLLETGGGLKNIESWIHGDPILVYNGDILTQLDLNALIQSHQASDDIATLALFPAGPNCNVAVDGDRIVDLRHARGIHPGTHQFTGIYIIEASILEHIPADTKVSVVPAFLELAKLGKIGAHIVEDVAWQDLGTREEYLKAHFNHPHTAPNIHPSAQIHKNAQIDQNSCFIGPNCVVEKGAKLRNTILWPSAVVAENAELDGCIVRQFAQGIHHNQDL